MQNYLNLMKEIMDTGVDRSDRTGVGTRAVFGKTLSFNLADGFPMVTTRKIHFRTAFEETMFFLRGETDTKKLEEKKINIWKGNTTREFLDSRGLTHLPEGDMGKGYGYQWTNWEKYDIVSHGDYDLEQDDSETYHCAEVHVSYINQVKQVIEGIKSNPYDRRHIIQAWNPGQLDEMALPPCHLYNQYVVMNGKLNSSFVMRSNDVYLGLPFNIMGYAFLNIAIAKICRLEPGELVYFGNDVHLYTNQFDVVKKQLTREPRPLPKLVIHKELNSYEDLCSLEFTDVEVIGYDPHPALEKVEMAI